jgi:formate dehydrogenase maturation protein FdhE
MEFKSKTTEVKLMAALQWLLDDLDDSGEARNQFGDYWDSVANAHEALTIAKEAIMRPKVCPKCDSQNIEGEAVLVDWREIARAYQVCHTCATTWDEVYNYIEWRKTNNAGGE